MKGHYWGVRESSLHKTKALNMLMMWEGNVSNLLSNLPFYVHKRLKGLQTNPHLLKPWTTSENQHWNISHTHKHTAMNWCLSDTSVFTSKERKRRNISKILSWKYKIFKKKRKFCCHNLELKFVTSFHLMNLNSLVGTCQYC